MITKPYYFLFQFLNSNPDHRKYLPKSHASLAIAKSLSFVALNRIFFDCSHVFLAEGTWADSLDGKGADVEIRIPSVDTERSVQS